MGRCSWTGFPSSPLSLSKTWLILDAAMIAIPCTVAFGGCLRLWGDVALCVCVFVYVRVCVCMWMGFLYNFVRVIKATCYWLADPLKCNIIINNSSASQNKLSPLLAALTVFYWRGDAFFMFLLDLNLSCTRAISYLRALAEINRCANHLTRLSVYSLGTVSSLISLCDFSRLNILYIC